MQREYNRQHEGRKKFAGIDVKEMKLIPVQFDRSLEPSTPEAWLVVLRAFDEAMARTSDSIGARPEDLSEIPLFFGRSGGFRKRMADLQAGKKGTVNLPSLLKRFMKQHFPEYHFHRSDPEELWFRKAVAPTLDLLLRFEKVHQWGLGKTFTIDFAVDFPGTPFCRTHGERGRLLKNIFWIFHESWERKVWAYTTSTELLTALQGCRDLLSRILPVLEQQCCELLLPPPVTLPTGIVELGPISAREAYNTVLPIARRWARDAEMESIGTGCIISMPTLPITEGGRLRRAGDWKVKFISKSLDRYCWYVVPHTGRVWWDFYPVTQNATPKYSSVLTSDEWVDSTEIAPRAFEAIKKQLSASHLHYIGLALCDPQRYSGNFVWRASCISYGESLPQRRDITVYLDFRTGTVLGEEVR
jgi:hypothetical protein